VEIQAKPNQSFPLTCRLTFSYEFDAVFDQNEARISSVSLLLLAKPNNLGFNRLGMIVSKKTIPKSAHRNKVKRRIREAFRKTVPVKSTGWDIVVMTRPQMKSQSNLTSYLQDSFTALAEKLT
jgi:ribonuclease P protein component